ncbi:MAG: DNA alkylation repair protein [Tissierellia bacterium]|nr:DNA alkylation repair protein [Tissierellia bacterium]
MANLNEQIKISINENIDEEYRVFHTNLLPNIELDILGVRMPVLRKIANSIPKEDIEETFLNTEMDSHEIVLVHGFLINRAKVDLENRLNMIREFVPHIKSWAICDSFCSNLKFTNKNLDEVWNFLLEYRNLEEEYKTRFMLIMYMDYYLEDEYIDEILELVNRDDSKHYYINMAKAWLLATAMIKYEDKVIKMLKNSNLDPWTHNKAIQKARESFRIDAELKEYLKSLKK